MSDPNFRRPFRNAATVILLLSALSVAAISCARSRPIVVIPALEDAAHQYRYAIDYRETHDLKLIGEDNRFHDTREIIRQQFQRVVDLFPQDRVFTPLARLDLLDMQAGLDHDRVKVGPGKVHKTIEYLRDLAADYPEHKFIQAKTLYDIGLCHKMLGEYEAMQKAFRALMDQFTVEDPDESVRMIVQRAQYYYQRTYSE